MWGFVILQPYDAAQRQRKREIRATPKFDKPRSRETLIFPRFYCLAKFLSRNVEIEALPAV